MNIGVIIKHKRLKLKMTQKDLAQGICSISHLSKIENNSKEVNEETLKMLLEKLDMDLQEIQGNQEKVDEKLEVLLKSIVFENKLRAENTYKELVLKEENILLSNLSNKYHIYMLRYYAFVGDDENFTKLFKIIRKLRHNFSQEERNMLKYSIISKFLNQSSKRLDEYLDILIELYYKYEDKMSRMLHSEIALYISYIYLKMNDFQKSIFFAREALQEYSLEFNFIKIIYAQNIIAKCYTILNCMNQAMSIYESLLNSLDLLNDNFDSTDIYLGYAFYLKRSGCYSKALENYEKIYEKLSVQSDEYLECVNGMAQCYFYKNNISEALEYFLEYLKKAKSKEDINEIFARYFISICKMEKLEELELEKTLIEEFKRCKNLKLEIDFQTCMKTRKKNLDIASYKKII